MNQFIRKHLIRRHISKAPIFIALFGLIGVACQNELPPPQPMLTWYVFNERSGAFREAAEFCSQTSGGRYQIRLIPLPSDADQQREQLVRRLAAADSSIDIIGMDVIWTAEFAEAGWVLPWPEQTSSRIANGRLPAALKSGQYKSRVWAIPFTSNAQLLWYRNDRIVDAPSTWQALLSEAEMQHKAGALQLQGQRYEGFTVFFVSLLASAGGSILDQNGAISLEDKPTLETLALMKRIGNSPAVSRSLATDREDQSRLGFETGLPVFMLNYSFVWPSAQQNAPEVFKHMGFSRWPSVGGQRPSRVSLGGINLGVAAYTPNPELAFEAAECLASAENQIKAAIKGGMPPTLEALYDYPEIRRQFPFADVLRETLRNAVLRPTSPVYNDISLAVSRTLHPMRDIEPRRDLDKLRLAIQRALDSEGLL
ncbi:ABC transporter substrate-binding protein [Methylomonas sp. MgM2]